MVHLDCLLGGTWVTMETTSGCVRGVSRLADMRGLTLNVGSTTPRAGILTVEKGESELGSSFLTVPHASASSSPPQRMDGRTDGQAGSSMLSPNKSFLPFLKYFY